MGNQEHNHDINKNSEIRLKNWVTHKDEKVGYKHIECKVLSNLAR